MIDFNMPIFKEILNAKPELGTVFFHWKDDIPCEERFHTKSEDSILGLKKYMTIIKDDYFKEEMVKGL